jgi:hypothetical protein
MEILTQIIEILVGGITGVAEGVGVGLSSLAQSIFLVSGEGGAQTLSVMGTLIVVFAGISLALGLCRWVLNFLTSLGARNR